MSSSFIKKVLVTLFTIVATLFIIVSLAKLIFDGELLSSIMYLASSSIFLKIVLDIRGGKIDIEEQQFNLICGFSFTILGLKGGELWYLDLILWISGVLILILNSRKKVWFAN